MLSHEEHLLVNLQAQGLGEIIRGCTYNEWGLEAPQGCSLIGWMLGGFFRRLPTSRTLGILGGTWSGV